MKADGKTTVLVWHTNGTGRWWLSDLAGTRTFASVKSASKVKWRASIFYAVLPPLVQGDVILPTFHPTLASAKRRVESWFADNCSRIWSADSITFLTWDDSYDDADDDDYLWLEGDDLPW